MTNSSKTMELSNNGEEIKVLFNLDDGDFWITLNRESAISMATLLLKHAQEIKKRNLTQEKNPINQLRLLTVK